MDLLLQKSQGEFARILHFLNKVQLNYLDLIYLPYFLNNLYNSTVVICYISCRSKINLRGSRGRKDKYQGRNRFGMSQATAPKYTNWPRVTTATHPCNNFSPKTVNAVTWSSETPMHGYTGPDLSISPLWPFLCDRPSTSYPPKLKYTLPIDSNRQGAKNSIAPALPLFSIGSRLMPKNLGWFVVTIIPLFWPATSNNLQFWSRISPDISSLASWIKKLPKNLFKQCQQSI